MLRAKILTGFVLIFLLAAAFWPHTSKSTSSLRRVTNTSDQVINLNPTLSGDGRRVAFESTGDLALTGGEQSFHALIAQLETEPTNFYDIGRSRLIAPALSQDGGAIAFSSSEDLVGQNADRNSEIFLWTATHLRQITSTASRAIETRLVDGCFQPSITDDGRLIAFSSNRDLTGLNGDFNFEIFLFEALTNTLTQLTDTNGRVGAADAKLSGNGSTVIFINNHNSTSAGRDLVQLNLNNKVTRIIASDAPGLALTSGRAVSDDGVRVVYAVERVPHESQVFLFDSNAGDSRQITSLGNRVSEVALNPTISGDGKRLAFATRRRVTAASDGSVELYLYDIPTAEFTQLTAAPANAIAEVVSSLNDDGSVAVFNFPRLLANGDSGNETSNNCEIFLAYAPSRPPFSPMTVFNGASVAESTPIPVLPAGGIAIAMGHALANVSLHAIGTFPSSLAGTSITVAGFPAQLLFVSPTQVNFVVPSEAPPGLTDFVVTNADGFESRASALISNAAPGIFTTAGDGQGEGVILDAETSLVAPFDPTNGKLRLSIFATGVRNAANVSCVISGQAVPVEAVMSSPDLPGLDEVHVFIPRTLRGAGEVGLVIMADGVESNSVTTTLSGSSVRDIVINEILADPPDGLAGDANHDGVRGASDDEFVELVNSTTRDLDLSGFQLQTRALNGATDVVRHRFPVGTSLPGGTALVVFGGGNIDSSNVVFSGARVVRASTGGISLSNTGGIVSVQDNLGSIVTTVQFGTSVPANDNQSLTRSPDVTGAFVLHSLAPDSQQRAYSPGTRVSGAPFLPLQPSPTPAPTPLPTPSVTPSPFPDPSPSPSPGARVVITQVYGGGGNTGAAFRNDFLEIRNTGDAAVDLTGWSVQYTGATSNSWSVTNLTSVSLSPGQYYLIQEASGGTNGQNLPAADASGVINLAAGAGKVALVNTRTALTGACPVNSSIIDLVGYGSSANCFLGTGPAPAPSNSVALLRLASGCVDTQNNAMDFATGAPTPRNSSSELSPCTNASTKLSILPHKMQTHMPLQEGPVREADAGGFGFAALPLSVRKACGFPSGLPLLQREALPRAAARQSLGSFKKGPRRKARGFTHGRRQTRK